MNGSTYELNKRTKFSYSCHRCRKRKIKCDRQTPCCGACLEKGEIETCKYDSNPWKGGLVAYEPGNSQLRKEIGTLKNTVNFLENIINRQREALKKTRKNSSIEIPDEQEDQKLKVNMSDFHILLLKNLRLTYCGPTNYLSLLRNDQYGVRILAKYAELQETKILETGCEYLGSGILNSRRMPVTEDCSRILEPLQLEVPCLPSHETLIFLIERFFRICYPLAPFLLKESFMKNISPLWECKRYFPENISLIKRGVQATLLIMLRFASLTLSSESKSTEPIINLPSSYIEYSKMLLLSSEGFERINLEIIQAILLLRNYKTVCPEDDNESSDSRLLLGIVIDMAVFQGFSLNSKVNLFISKQELYIRSNIWIQLLYDDASTSFNFGLKPSISDFDIEELYKLLEEEGTEFDIERKSIMRQSRLKLLAISLIQKVVLLMNNRNQEIVLLHVLNILDDFNNLLYKEMYNFQELLNSDIGFNNSPKSYRVVEFIMRVDLYSKSFMLYYFLFLVWNDEMSSEYCRSRFLFLVMEKGMALSLLGDYFTKDTSLFFGVEFEKLIGTSIFSSLAKVIPTMVCLLCRSLDGEFNLPRAVQSFESSDFDLISWANIDITDNKVSIKNVIIKYKELYQKSIQVHAKYFITYKVCICLQFSLDFIQRTYPTLFQDSLLSVDSDFIREINKFLEDNSDSLKNFIDYDFDYNLFLSFLEEN